MIVTPDEVIDGYIVFENGKIECIGCEDCEFDGETLDYGDSIVTAGFVEMHVHGAGGSDFLNGSAEEMIAGCDLLYSHGVTTICPTVTSAPFADMKRGLLAIEEIHKGALRVGYDADIVVLDRGYNVVRVFGGNIKE